jgi:hypothetical protein
MSILAFVGESERFFSPVQSHMLHGLLADDEKSNHALAAWASMVDIDDLDAASYRLIPALYARAGHSPAMRGLSGRMKGIYRYFFYRNNRFLAFIQNVFSALLSAEVDFIVFKGISILLQYHDSAAGRTSSDCDILVRSRDKARAQAVLAGRGLVYRYDDGQKQLDRHSHDFTNGAGHDIDLHWYALPEVCEEGIDEGFWNRSRQIVWKDLRLRVLAPEDEMLVAGMNGIREIEAARGDWLHDACLVFKAVPDFDWRLLHGELKRRGLRRQFLAAVGLLQCFVPNFPNGLVKKVFREEIREVARQRVAENRSFALDAKTDRELTAMVAPSSAFRRLLGAVSGTDWRARIALSGDVVRHLRYDVHDDGSVERIYAHRDFVEDIPEIFDVIEPASLREAKNLSCRRDEVEFTLPPGVLCPPRQPIVCPSNATLKPPIRSLEFSSPDIASLPIKVCVSNASTRCWCVLPGSQARFGLSYHLFTADGELVCWEMPRSYFLTALQGQVVALRPADSLQIQLEILRPPGPGRYEARLDVVQELVAWFDPDGTSFPRLLVEVS